MCKLKSLILGAVCAMFLGTAAGTPQNSCKDLADYIQASNQLPPKPDEDGVISYVSGSVAKKMFPGQASRISYFRKYSFASYFNSCTLAPSYVQVQVKSGPYSQKTTSNTAYNLGLDVGFDKSLSDIWEYLPKLSVKAGVTRGYEKVEVTGVEIKEGELKQECLLSAGWYCTGQIKLDDFDSGEVIVSDAIRSPKFFPASLNGKHLYSDVWLALPSSHDLYDLHSWFQDTL
ncbi:hypothetical protein BGX28_008856 [Mortierella sp. GBA30]|nr:hypothetical protein BGX28_008856 [Mortierella sp. GBA30]